MGTYLKQCDKDSMKMAILKQEETFRQQVHELHRLYRIQKLMMNDMKIEIKRQRRFSIPQSCSRTEKEMRRPRQELDLELPAEEYIDHKVDRNSQLEVEEENDLELTLATGSRSGRKESSLTSDSGASFSSSSTTESGGVKINGCRSKWGLFQVPDMKIGSYQSDRKISFSVDDDQMREGKMKQQQQQPPWLFQCLSLNMT